MFEALLGSNEQQREAYAFIRGCCRIYFRSANRRRFVAPVEFDDLWVEVATKLLNRAKNKDQGSLDLEGKADGYVFVTARNTAVDQHRKTKREVLKAKQPEPDTAQEHSLPLSRAEVEKAFQNFRASLEPTFRSRLDELLRAVYNDDIEPMLQNEREADPDGSEDKRRDRVHRRNTTLRNRAEQWFTAQGYAPDEVEQLTSYLRIRRKSKKRKAGPKETP